MEFLRLVILGNTVLQWATAVLVVVLVMLAVFLIERVLILRMRRLAQRTRNTFDDLIVDMLENTRPYLVFFVAVYFGTIPLVLPADAIPVIRTAALIAVLIQAALWGNQVITFFLRRLVRQQAADPAAGATTFTTLNFISRLALWSLVVILVLDNIPGVEITSLIAGLGITGIAVALAVQNILGDLFGSLSIVLDKPFVIGDFVVIDDLSGTVEHIGLKTTRIRSLSGEELVFANTDLLNSRIRNFKKMNERRGVFSLGVTYETPYEKARQIPDVIQEIVEAQPLVRLDRVHFKSFGSFALEYEVAYYLQETDFNVYMDIQQAINLEIMRRFREMGITFAYPTQKLYVTTIDGSPGLPAS